MPRLLLVSNRLPITVKIEQRDVMVESSAGGLATGLAGLHTGGDSLWIGWPGDTTDLSDSQRMELDDALCARRTSPVHLTSAEVRGYYEGFSNAVIWPLFHLATDRLPLHAETDFDIYRAVNQRFADSTIAHYTPGDWIWVHDYHLALVPGLIRSRIPEARIGFFLHIPFPPVDLYRILPCREAMLAGVLGADLIGFHTASYARHFRDAIEHVLQVATAPAQVSRGGRTARIGVFPMGIDATGFDSMARSSAVAAAVGDRSEAGGQRMLLGIDRLDYTKGIPRRLLAVERLLDRDPQLRGRLRFVQVVVPSRLEVPEYASLERQVNELVGRINGKHGTLDGAPVQYLFRAFSPIELSAMYRSADVMLVTPLVDGMNLVAKEFVASRVDEDGVLVLSEFAGAASELSDALLVNPYDIGGMAEAFARALRMPAEERTRRMRSLRSRVAAYDVQRWARTFVEELARTPDRATKAEVPRLAARLGAAERLVLLLDYDGTLMPFVDTPSLAAPDAELRDLLTRLVARRGTTVHMVSGRPRETLDVWLGELGVGLHAEHGLWSKRPGGEWVRRWNGSTPWKGEARGLMDAAVAATPGAFVEEKSVTLAWHYRASDATLGVVRAQALADRLGALLDPEAVEVVEGDKVVEVRPKGVHKGRVVLGLADELGDACVVAMGDDRTDEDLFAALPAAAVAVHVGPRPSEAALRLPDVAAARALLRMLLERSALVRAA